MSDDLVRMVATAAARGERSLRTEPRARKARYDRRTGRVHVDLITGCSFSFPARNAQGLERASHADLAQVEILELGLGLRGAGGRRHIGRKGSGCPMQRPKGRQATQGRAGAEGVTARRAIEGAIL
jgi:hypothetical protein